MLKGLVPERFLDFLLKKHHILPESNAANIAHSDIKGLIVELKHFRLKVNGSQPIEKAFVTGGGVSIKEVVPNTMQSKVMHGLYFCGEILDIHGYTGGYNITSAFVTGHVAGMNAAWEALAK